jgi:hypothetical protein
MGVELDSSVLFLEVLYFLRLEDVSLQLLPLPACLPRGEEVEFVGGEGSLCG